MNTRAKFATLFAAGSLFLAGASAQAMANSATTDTFVANIRPAVDFLDRSSRMALEKTKSPAVRAFAHREALEQTIAANSLVAWTQANTVPGAAVALQTPVVPVAPVVVSTAPVVAATEPVAAATEVVTGRSVAVDRPLTVTPAPRDVAVSGTRDTLDRLSTLSGRAFDILYHDTQVASLRQLSALYSRYIQAGDDAGLRAMAIREMPKINRRLVELRQF